MRIIAISILCCLVLGCRDQRAQAQRKDHFQHRFSITFPAEHQTHGMTTAHTRWRKSLVKNLGHTGNAHVFMLTDISLFDGGTPRQGCVYQNSVKTSQFLVTPFEDLWQVIIDREIQEIGTMGVAGISLHPHPDGKMVVCLEPTPGSGILGVPLSDTWKTGATLPVFTNTTVYWTWGEE